MLFVFYGEVVFAGYEVFKQNLQIHYVPDIFIQHRVNINERKNNNDYVLRNRRAIRSGWYLWILFIPLKYIPKYWLYSVYTQLRTKVIKGDYKVLAALIMAFNDVMFNTLKLIRNRNRLTSDEYQNYLKIPSPKIYWQSNKTING